MNTLKKKRRIQVVSLALVALVVATGLIISALGDGVNFYRAPTEVAETPPPADEVFRIGGLVEPGTLERGMGTDVRFSVTDGNVSIPVIYRGVLPDLFAEGQGMVGLGQYDGLVFTAREILAKHDESYMPKEVIDTLKEQGVYQEPDGS